MALFFNTHTLQARCGTFLTSAIRPISLSHTPTSNVRYIAFPLRTNTIELAAEGCVETGSPKGFPETRKPKGFR